ncbi:MAG TPA: hypothetical protein VFJ51_12845 [Nitrososphaeraceae archaeon]|nr:hypothetical protein [Nitrososphaeraceae archaeon]
MSSKVTPKKTLGIFLMCFSLLMITLATTITTTNVFVANISYAQLPFFPGLSQQPTPSQQPSPTPAPTLPAHAVTITSPKDGQQVPIGQDLQVTGTSIPNAASSDCKITVNLNGIKPYQPVVGNGPGGGNDYSQWSSTLTPSYAAIQEGQNRITARIACASDPNLRQFVHANVTGVAQ